MASIANPEISQALRNARPSRLRAANTGRVEHCLTAARSKSVTAEKQSGNFRIRAWRAADAEVSQAPQRANRHSAMLDAKPAGHFPGVAIPTGPRPNGPDRAARMRAVEQAWKAERTRQAEIEAADAEGETRQSAQARPQAAKLERAAEAQREADERIRAALERAKRFRLELSAEAGANERSRVDGDRAGGRGTADRSRRR